MKHRYLSPKNLGVILLVFTMCSASARDFSSVNGQKLSGEVIKYYGDYVLFKRSADHQLFRFKMEVLCDKDQAFVKNNFAPDREDVPTLPRPLSSRDITKFALGVDGLVEAHLRKYQATSKQNHRGRGVCPSRLFKNCRKNSVLGRNSNLPQERSADLKKT